MGNNGFLKWGGAKKTSGWIHSYDEPDDGLCFVDDGSLGSLDEWELVVFALTLVFISLNDFKINITDVRDNLDCLAKHVGRLL